MARKLKEKTVSKFGGTESLGSVTVPVEDAPVKDATYDILDIEVKSDTKLEEDDGSGGAAIVRRFVFAMNPKAFHEHTPSKQELFNTHLKGIEMSLWRDGMKIMTDVTPRINFDTKNMQYSIIVGAVPQRGHILRERPQKLAEIIHG